MNMEQVGIGPEQAVPQIPQEPAPEMYVPYEVPVQEPIRPEDLLKKDKKPGKKPPVGVRVLLQIISFILCLLLTVSVLATALLIDVNHLTSEGGIKQIINGLFFSTRPRVPSVLLGAGGVAVGSGNSEDDTDSDYIYGYVDENGNYVTGEGNITTDEDGNIIITDENGNVISGGQGGSIIVDGSVPDDFLDEIPEDILAGGGSAENVGALIDWIYEAVDEATEGELHFTKEQLYEFVQESTVVDYMSEKLAGFADDILNGTENTKITADELIELLEENEELLEETFGVEVTPEFKEELRLNMEKVVEESNINETIRDTVNEVLEESVASSSGVSLDEIMATVRMIAADSTMYAAIGVCVFLVLLLIAVNYYNVPAALTWASVPCIFIGLILSAPIAAIQFAPSLLISAVPELIRYISMISGFVGALAPVHYGLLCLGLAMLLASIAWRIIRSVVRHNRAMAAST